MRYRVDLVTIFELFFGLTSVMLGLALTHIVSSLQKLANAGRRVNWALEPILATLIILTVIVSVWIGQWSERDASSITMVQAFLQVAKMMAVYFAAASVLPDVEPGDATVDLYRYYDETRRLTFGSLIVGLLLFQIYFWSNSNEAIRWDLATILQVAIYPSIYLSLMLIRWRPYNIGILAFALIYYGFRISTVQIGS